MGSSVTTVRRSGRQVRAHRTQEQQENGKSNDIDESLSARYFRESRESSRETTGCTQGYILQKATVIVNLTVEAEGPPKFTPKVY